MAVSKEELQDDIPWDVERIPLGIGEHASDDAMELLEEIEDVHDSVERVAAYARRGREETRVGTTHLLRTLQHADGRLALVTWGSGGITAISYHPDEQRFEVGSFDGLAKVMGNEPESYQFVTRAIAKDKLAWSKPSIVLRNESKLLPELNNEVSA